MEEIRNDFEALVGALYLALTASTQENVDRAVKLAQSFTTGLTPDEIHNAKLMASAKANGTLEIITA
jgi:hypothetical protein